MSGCFPEKWFQSPTLFTLQWYFTCGWFWLVTSALDCLGCPHWVWSSTLGTVASLLPRVSTTSLPGQQCAPFQRASGNMSGQMLSSFTKNQVVFSLCCLYSVSTFTSCVTQEHFLPFCPFVLMSSQCAYNTLPMLPSPFLFGVLSRSAFLSSKVWCF